MCKKGKGDFSENVRARRAIFWIAKILKNKEYVSVDPVQNAPLDRFWGALRDSYVDFFS
jgi:hypothetical protein